VVFRLTLPRESGQTWLTAQNLALELRMEAFSLPIIVQLALAVGVAGLLWPEKVKPVFEVLMFPWFPTYRMLRVHSIAAIAISFLLFLAWVVRLHP
jgi:hypothetical protein